MKNALCAAIVLLFVSSPCFAQKTFKLNIKIDDEGPFCFVREAAIDIANGGDTRAAEAILEEYFKDGTCVIMRATTTYLRKVYRHDKFRVYEGRVGGITVFSPTLWIAEDEKDL